VGRNLRRGRRLHIWSAVMDRFRAIVIGLTITLVASAARASGHGPVFGATTPTLGRGGWSIDQAWTIRDAGADQSEQMFKTMISFGATENLQLSGSFPLAMSDSSIAPGRMMSLMSNDREFEGLVGYRFQRRTIGIG